MPLIQEELAQHSFRQSLISNPAAVELTQANREGSALVQAVRAAFHEV
jgi:hypothetical protein